MTAFALVALILTGILIFMYYPRFEQLKNRSERMPIPTSEVYAIALNSAKKAYQPFPPKGRDIFVPALSIYVRSRTPINSIRTRTPVPSTVTTPIPSRTAATATPTPSTPTPTPFVMPLSLVGIYKSSEDSDRVVILKENSTGKYHTLKVGDVIANLRIIEIAPTFVKLQGPLPSDRIHTLNDPRALQSD